MKKNPFRATAASALLAFCTLATAQAHGRIHWETDFYKALKEAKSSGKYLMVDFYSDRVYWSMWLNTYTYTDDRVVNLSKQFIPVRLDDRKANDAISVRYGVTGCPTVLFIDGAGKALASGYGAPGSFSLIR